MDDFLTVQTVNVFYFPGNIERKPGQAMGTRQKEGVDQDD